MNKKYGLLLSLLPLVTAAASAEPLPPPVDFNREIRPILSDKCFSCHGPDKKKRKGRLRLDLEASAREAEKSAIVPGKLEESELYIRITTDDTDERMPPEESGKSLTAKEIKLLSRWITEGARWSEHWA